MEKKSFVEKYARILVIIAVFCGGASGPLAAKITASALVIGLGRLTVALPFFAVPVLRNREKREAMLKLPRRTVLLCGLTGVFLFLHFFCWFTSVKYANVSAAAVLAAFHPLVVLAITVFIYKKRVPGKAIVAIVIALAAGAYMTCSDLSAFSDGRAIGYILAFLSGVFMGIYFAIGKKAHEGVEGSTYVFLVFLSCWICFVIAVIVTGTPVLGYPATDYLFIVLLAFVCQIGSHAVWNLCLGMVEPLYVSAWESMDPVVSTILAFVLIGQVPTLTEVVCCIIVVAALIMYSRYESENE